MTTTIATNMTPTKTTIGIGELIISDDRRRLDAEAGNHEHEDRPDQYKKHGKSPFPTLAAARRPARYDDKSES